MGGGRKKGKQEKNTWMVDERKNGMKEARDKRRKERKKEGQIDGRKEGKKDRWMDGEMNVR